MFVLFWLSGGFVVKKQVFALSDKEKQVCVELAKKSIKHSLINEGRFELRSDEVASLSENFEAT